MFWRKSNRNMNALEVADLIERFLNGRELHPMEWNDFTGVSQLDKAIEAYRKRCDELDPLVNRPGDMDPAAVAELASMIHELRGLGGMK